MLVYICDFLCNFCRTFQCNFCRARARDKNWKCKLTAISVLFVAAKLDATWRPFGGNCSKYRTGIAAKSLLVTLATKVALESATKIAPKIACVNGP